ncbi:hypothetical protein [Pseudoalteromonas sp. G4]|uniref:hypothetical protein n=1 Tax=Pseudoalteromonas sp. G4 TaxID=2992761 RepID=UPI00237E4490|nr:hypothetical protein [Pseudoalteromonas sp. G4]MDE3270409.1 hypothetical protein [Pseudoalteromonas sp. G4]
MLKKSLLSLAILSTLPLTGCLKVEDSDSKDTIIVEQAELTTASVQAVLDLIDPTTNEPISGTQVRYQVGVDWSDSFTVSNGQVVIDNLPGNSDVLVEVTSPDNTYLKRVFYFKTSMVSQGQNSVQNLGTQYLYRATTASFTILDSANSVIEDVKIGYPVISYLSNGYWTQGFSNRVNATYDAQNGNYTLLVPQGSGYDVEFDGDIDNDGIDDYYFGYDDFGSRIHSSRLLNADVVYAKKTVESQEFPVNITLLSKQGELIENNEAVFISSEFKLPQALTFDQQQQAYSFVYKGSAAIKVNIAEIEFNGVSYNAGYAKINPNDEKAYVFFDNVLNQSREYVLNDQGELNLVVMLEENDTNSDSNYHFRALSNYINSENNSLNLFLSHPIELSEDSVAFSQKNVVVVTRGNESDNDMVPPGTTLIERKSVDLSVSSKLEYNNSFLTVTPNAELSTGEYRYEVNNLRSVDTGNVYSKQFTNEFEFINSNLVFNIDDIKVDNNNGFTLGLRSIEKNTAGVIDDSSYNSNTPALYLPLSISSLDYLDITVIKSVKNSNQSDEFSRYSVVENGEIKVGKRFIASLAKNENVESNYSSYYQLHTSLEQGEYYSFSLNNVGYHFYDDTSESKNTITINYEYKVKGSNDVVSGTKELSVH